MSAIKFLKKWAPEGPWVLTSIQVDKKGIDTKTFYPKDEASLVEWLKAYNKKRNIYFHVNPPMHDLKKKANREDIKSVDFLHVDIDPEPDRDLDEERDRCLGLLTTDLPRGVPKPTVIIFSGGGYQGFWKLKQPIPVNGDLGLAEDAKLYNQQLELLFGADNCHNIDRIMRLPGTMNIPDARKLKKGRKEELAKLLSFEDKHVYDLKQFTKAAAVQIAGDVGFSAGEEIKISGNVERIADLSELDQWDVSDRVKVIIAQGTHPDQLKEGDNSRSAWLFDAVCQLVRSEVPDDVIFSIITDPEFGIAESVLAMKSNAEKYAIRQIGKAKEHAIDPWLVKLNEQHAVIGNTGGKCRVVEETMDHGLNRTTLTRQSFEDFRNRYMNKTIPCGEDAQGNPKMMAVGKWWLLHPKRRQFETIVFAPGKEIKGAYNLWKGFACTSQPGDCGLFLDHIHDNVCAGNEEIYKYLMGWMARCVQKPDNPGYSAIVLKGGRGIGKSFFAKEFGKLFGRHFLQVSNSSHLVGNFNAHLRDTLVVFADEAFYANDKKHESVLKMLISEETIPIEAKGVDLETAPNYIHLIMASNDDHVIPAGLDERRFLVLEVLTTNKKDTKYFKAMTDQLEGGGREALLNYLMVYDLSDFDVRTVPDTDALQEQKLLSLSPEQEWWYRKLQEGRLIQHHTTWQDAVLKDALVDDYVENARRFNISRRGTATSLGKFLKRVVPTITTKQLVAEFEVMSGDGFTRMEKRRAYHYLIPTLEQCRARWEELSGKENWDAPIETQEELGKNKEPF